MEKQQMEKQQMQAFENLKNEHRAARQLVRDMEHQMAEEVMNFKGSLQDAIECGMVKYNFPVPKWSRLSREAKQTHKIRRLG